MNSQSIPSLRNAGLVSLVVTAAALAAPASSQVPDGYYAVSSWRQPASVFTGDGGIYLAHPRRPGSLLCVTGLPAALTGAGYGGSGSLGASGIVLDPSTGHLVVGTTAPARQPISLHVVSLTGTAGTVVRTIPLGRARNPGGAILQFAFVQPDVVLVAANNLAGLPAGTGPTTWVQVFTTNLTTGAVTPLSFGGWNPTGAVRAVAYDRVSGMAYLGVETPTSSALYRFPLQAPAQVSTMLPGMSGACRNLAVESDGNVIVSSVQLNGAGLPSLLRVDPDPPFATTALSTTWANVRAVAVEPTTGALALAGSRLLASTATGGVHWFEQATGAITPLANLTLCGARGPLSGIAVAPAPVRCGTPSGPSPTYRWSTSPHPDRLPRAGNAAFFVDVAWPAPATSPALGVCFAGVAKAAQPIPIPSLGVSLLLDPAALLSLPMILQPGSRRSVLSFPLPTSAPLGAALFLQSLHLAGTGVHATEGLRVTIL